MKKLLIIPVLIALISPLIHGGDYVIADDKIVLTDPLDEYDGNELTKLSDTQYKIDYPGTGSRIEIGSKLSFNTDLKISHWNDEVSFSLIAPVDINSKSQLTADMYSDFVTDKVIADNGEWNFEYYAVWPNEFNESGGIDIIITAKEKPTSNKIYFTYDSTTVTPYYQGELTPEEIEEGASRPEHVIGSIAFYANDKANHAIGGVNYKTGKIGHLYAMRAGSGWARWSIEGEYIVLTIPDKVYNGAYPLVISPVGDTFGYTSAGGSNSGMVGGWTRGSHFLTSGAGTGTSMSVYAVHTAGTPKLEMALYDDSHADGDPAVYIDETSEGDVPGAAAWVTENFVGSPAISDATVYWLMWNVNVSSVDYFYDTDAGNIIYRQNVGYSTWPDPLGGGFDESSSKLSIYCTYTPSGGNDPPTVTTDSSSSVEETTATLTGTITDTGAGGENADIRGFQWGTSTGVYSTNVTEAGNFSTGSYNLGATGLPQGDKIYWRAEAHNSEGWGYGSELTLHTKPVEPDTLAVTDQDHESIDLSWNKGTGAEYTIIRHDTGGYPADYNSGTLSYNNTGTSCTVSGLNAGQIYYFRAWSISTDDGNTYSDSYAEVTDYTLPADPANLALSGATCNTLDAEWTAGTGGDKSMVRWKEGSYPANESDGTQGYFDTSNSTTITGLPDTTLIYVAVFAYDSDSGYYSDGSSQDSANTTATVDPTFTTNAATDISASSARLNGTISALTCENASDVFWEWGLSTGNYTANYTDTTDYGNGAVYHDISGLSASTEYFFRGAARLDGGAWQYGGELSFNTTANYPPTVTTANATDLDCSSVTGNGNLTDEGSANVTTRGFQYGIGAFTDNVSESGDFETGVFDLSITGLEDNTEYQYRVFATNEYGTSYGDSVNFTTTASADPTFTTSNATAITNTSARLNGTISGLTCAQADDTFWEWGLSSGNYTSNYTDTTNRNNGAVYHDISSLTANTTYYFRGAARLNGGTYQYGTEFYFTTTNISVCLAPTNLTLTAVMDNQILAEWDAVEGAGSYLLLASNTGYPDDPAGSFAVAYNGTETSVTLEGYNLDFTTYYFSVWSQCNPYSDDYDTASIGGEAMESISDSFVEIIKLLVVFGLVVLAYWRKDVILYIIAAITLILYGLDYTSTTMVMGIMVIFFGIWTFIKGVIAWRS